MKEKPGADYGLDQPRRVFLAGGRIDPRGTSLVRFIKDRPLSSSVRFSQLTE